MERVTVSEIISGIYYIKNELTNKYYVGQSNNIYKRINEHYRNFLRHEESRHLQYSWDLYGNDFFTWDILEICSVDILNEKEIEYIALLDSYNNGYNLTIGGDGAVGIKFTEEQKKRISEGLKGRVRSKEHSANISASKKKYFETNAMYNAQRVVCLNTGEIFDCIRFACNKYNMDVSAVHKCCKGKFSYIGIKDDIFPLVWRYEEDYLKMSEQEIEDVVLNAYDSTRHKLICCIETEQIFSCMADVAIMLGMKKEIFHAMFKKGKSFILNGQELHFVKYVDCLR